MSGDFRFVLLLIFVIAFLIFLRLSNIKGVDRYLHNNYVSIYQIITIRLLCKIVLFIIVRDSILVLFAYQNRHTISIAPTRDQNEIVSSD